MSYWRPCASVTFSNRKALRWLSGKPRNCSRTSGCSSVSLLIGTVTRTSLPACSSPSTYCPSVGQYDAVIAPSPFFVAESSRIHDELRCRRQGVRFAGTTGGDAARRFFGDAGELERDEFRFAPPLNKLRRPRFRAGLSGKIRHSTAPVGRGSCAAEAL